MIVFSFILAFLLSGLIAFTYKKTTNNDIKHPGLLQTFIAGALISAMVLQAIGDNIASGLAMLGALNVIQYRTNFKNPRDSIFVFASLGCGIACGLYGFLVAILGVSFFCVLSFVIWFSPYHFSNFTVWSVKMKAEESVRLGANFNSALDEYCSYWTLESISADKEKVREEGYVEKPTYNFTIKFKDESYQRDFLLAMNFCKVKVLNLSKKEPQ